MDKAKRPPIQYGQVINVRNVRVVVVNPIGRLKLSSALPRAPGAGPATNPMMPSSTIRHFALAALAATFMTGAQAQTFKSVPVQIVVDAGQPGAPISPELLGVAWNWGDAGGGLLDFGEMIRDRSFRNQESPQKRAWIESPNSQIGGRVRYVKTGGDDKPWSGKGSPGHMVLSQNAVGYTCVSQGLLDGVIAGEQYELHLSARGEGGQPGISVFFSDQALMPIEKLDKLALAARGTWGDFSFTLKPEKTLAPVVLRICIVTAGELAVDEIRLRHLGAAPRLKPQADKRIRELGVRSLRWPTGSDADYFSWRDSVGPLRERAEIPNAYGDLQTASLGLHEFLDYCEASGIVPLITVNVREAPQNAADLVEYILGPKTSPMGALRARNGRAAPWSVRHFELGNEPVDVYRAEFDPKDTAKGYVKLAAAVSVAMRAKASQLNQPIALKGVLETGVAIADWISAVPMLSRWNGAVLDRNSGLRGHMDHIKGNFYSAFTWRSSERELFEEVMGGGATIGATIRTLNRDYGPLPPFWLTEYSVFVQKNKFVGGVDILLDHAKDFQSGMAAADILLTAIQEHFGGAYLFNLAQTGTWGIIANSVDFRLRPGGLAFSMVSRLAGGNQLPVTVNGAPVVTLNTGAGNNPNKTRYSTIAAVASQQDGVIWLAILNRSYDTGAKLQIDIKGAQPVRADISRLGPEKPTANNEEKPDNIRIKDATAGIDEARTITVAPRSLVRIAFQPR